MRYNELVNGFTCIEKSCSQIPFWFLNDKVDGDEYSRQIVEMDVRGVHQAMPHPRYGMDRRDYLTDKYWDAFDKLLKKADEIGFTIHLYDEFNWSSGPVGGRLTADSRNCAMAMGMRSKTVPGQSRVLFDEWVHGLKGWARREKYLSAVQVPYDAEGTLRMDKACPLPVPPDEQDWVEYQMPEGKWEVMVFYTLRTVHPSPLKMDNGGIIDYLSAAVTDKFIEATHEQYALRFKQYFGSTIQSIFYDETGPYASGPYTWTEGFEDQFLELKGYSLLEYLPLLFYDGGEFTEKVRCDYWDVVATLYAENFVGKIAGWCEEHGIALAGHTQESDFAWGVAAEPFRSIRKQQWPGIDSLLGYKPYHELIPMASIPHITGKKVFLCEALGCLGQWDVTPEMMRRAYNQLAVIGVTHLVPHAFFQTVDNPKVECPPSFFEQNLYWKYYEQIAQLTSRQCYINRQGRNAADIAVLYPIVSWWGDNEGGRGYGHPWAQMTWDQEPNNANISAYHEVIDHLMASHLNPDVIDSQALLEAEFADGHMKIADGSYRILILPPMNTVRISDMLKINQFCDRGGILVVVGQWPHITMEKGRNDTALFEIIKNIKENTTFVGKAVNLPGIIREKIDCDVTVLDGGDVVDISHRLINGADFFLFSNHSDDAVAVKALVRARGKVSVWDPGSGGFYRLPYIKEQDNGLLIGLPLEPNEAIYLVAGEETPKELLELPLYKSEQAAISRTLDQTWSFIPVPEELTKTWKCDVGEQEVTVPVFQTRMFNLDIDVDIDLWNNWYKPGFDDSSWQTVHCLREPLLYNHTNYRAFRTEIPVGATAIKLPLPVSGEYALYVNGQCLRVVTEHMREEEGWLNIPHVEGIPGVIAIECASMKPDFGITGPLTFLCRPEDIHLKSWTELGLGWYSGFGLYRTRIEMNEIQSKCICLNLGNVKECAEVWVNGMLAGTRIWNPYRVDITQYLKPGSNDLSVVVSNLLSNRFSWDIWGSRGEGKRLESGLQGPVCIEAY